jgi:hypothetical protein
MKTKSILGILLSCLAFTAQAKTIVVDKNLHFDKETWTANQGNEIVIKSGGNNTYAVFIHVDAINDQNAAMDGIDIQHCYLVDHVDAGQSAVCELSIYNQKITFKPDGKVNGFSQGTYQIEPIKK